MSEPTRCGWCEGDALDTAYHDTEWGVPVRDDRTLFEFLILEGAQAGLSWRTILHKRAGYREAFDGFDIERVAGFSDARLDKLRTFDGIVRHKGKIESARGNARAALDIQTEFGSLSAYLWRFVSGRPLINHPGTLADIPTQTELSRQMSIALKKRGFRFVGPTICYAFMQATGMVMDHLTGCFRHAQLMEPTR